MTAPSDHVPTRSFTLHTPLAFFILLGALLFRALPLHAHGMIDPRSGQLVLSVTDLTVQAGPVTLEIRRSLDTGKRQPGLLGSRWRLNWEARLLRTGPLIVIQESTGSVSFSQQGPVGEYRSVQGERLVFDKTGQAIRTKSDGTKEIFDAHGRLAERDYRNGNRTVLHYGADGRVTRIDGPHGSFLRFTMDKAGRVVQIEASTTATVRYAYQGDDLTEVQRLPAPPIRYSYLKDGWLARIEEPLSGSVQFVYDFKGRVLSRQLADGSKERINYDDVANRLRYTDPVGAVTTIEWNQDKRRAEVTDPLGQRSVVEYDAVGCPLVITGPTGATSRTTCDAIGRPVAVQNPLGQVARFDYLSESTRPTKITHPDGRQERFEYDHQGNLTAVKLGSETIATFTYYPDGSLATQKGLDTPEERYSYHPDGQLKTLSNALGEATQFEYDARGNLIREINPLGGITVRQYDAHDRLISRTDPAGGMTRYEYDAKGQVGRLIDAGGAVTRFEYDARGRLVADVNPKGQVTRYEYDGAGRLSRIIEPGNLVSTFHYDLLGNLVTEKDPEGRTAQFEYDPLGRLRKERGPTGLEIVYQYDAAGNLVGLDDSLRTGIKLQRDPAGLLTAVVNPLGAVTRYEYNPFGNPLAVTDPLGRVTRYTYDRDGSLNRVMLPTGDEARYEYDPAGRLTAIHHTGGGVSRFSYDAMGQLNSLIDPAGARVERRYDPAGRLMAMTNAAGQITQFSYDRSDRLTEKQRSDGRRLRYQYDPLGTLIQADDGAFPIRFTYDQAGRLIRTDYPSIKKQVRYLYDQAGRRSALIDSAGREIRYDYTKTDQLQAILLPGGKRIALAYDQKDRLVTVRYPNGVTGQWEYDAAGNAVAIRYQGRDGQSLVGFAFRYDASGNPVEVRDHLGRTSRFQYDALDQLVEATGSEGTTRYRYLSGGNRARLEAAGTVTEYRYDQAGRLLQAGKETFGYDPDGNLVSRTGPAGTTWYEYDPDGRLVKAVGPDGVVTAFGYAPTGERAWKQGREGLHYFLYDDLDLIQELAEDGAPRATYVHAPGIDRPLAMIRDGKTYYYHANRLGSVTHLTDEQGRVVASYDYDPFGRIVRHEGNVTNPFTFTGREFDDETGLYYYRARYYDPNLGRFLSPDVIPAGLDEPLEQNPYLYVRNNPTRFVDPLGLASWDLPKWMEEMGNAEDWLAYWRQMAQRPNYPHREMAVQMISRLEPLVARERPGRVVLARPETTGKGTVETPGTPASGGPPGKRTYDLKPAARSPRVLIREGGISSFASPKPGLVGRSFSAVKGFVKGLLRKVGLIWLGVTAGQFLANPSKAAAVEIGTGIAKAEVCAAGGAALGSCVPVVGTAAGGAAGGLLGPLVIDWLAPKGEDPTIVKTDPEKEQQPAETKTPRPAPAPAPPLPSLPTVATPQLDPTMEPAPVVPPWLLEELIKKKAEEKKGQKEEPPPNVIPNIPIDRPDIPIEPPIVDFGPCHPYDPNNPACEPKGDKKPSDVKGATEDEKRFGGGGPEKSPTSGTAGGGPPIKVVDHEKPPTVGTGGPAGPGAGQWITCYSEKTGQSYPMPYGSACPPPHLAPPSVGGAPHDPSTHWWELVPKKSGEGGGHGGGSGGHP